MIIDHLDAPIPGSSLLPTPPGESYTSEEIFAREQRAIFATMWNCVLRASDLDRPGKWKKVTVAGEELIIIRTRREGIKAYFNVCRHRGMRVCIADQGESKKLQCGYHAWTYSLEGELVAAPNLTSMPDVDRKEYGLKTVPVREWLGYVWVCLADEPPSFEETVLSEVATRWGEEQSLDVYGIDDLAIGRTITYDVAANWKLIIENFMECYHCATIHPELTEVIPEFADGLASQASETIHGADFGEDVKGFTIDGSEGVLELPHIGDNEARKYFAITVQPHVFINTVPDHVIFHRMIPIAANRTIVICDWLFLPEVIDKGMNIDKSVELFDRVNQQDFEACELTQPAMSSEAYRHGGALVPSEHHIAIFHDWWRSRLRTQTEGAGMPDADHRTPEPAAV